MEYDVNDNILAKRFLLQRSPLNKTLTVLFNLPVTCFDQFLVDQFELLPPSSDNITGETSDIEQRGDYYVNISVSETRAALEVCGQHAESVFTQLFNETSTYVLLTASEQLTFNWIRCWNVSSLGFFPVWSPTKGQLTAAQNQAEFYNMIWRADQERLYEEYKEEANDSAGGRISRLKAFQLSVQDATGRHDCTENISGSAWFWFTVMTTVGR
jgi:hypothetical protein